MSYSITEVCKLYSLNASTLRYYEEIGLLKDVARSQSGHRIYTDAHIGTLHAISCFKKAGMSISEIQLFFNYENDIHNNIDNMNSLLNERGQRILDDFEELFESYKHILKKIDFYNHINDAIKSGMDMPSWDSFEDKDYSHEALSNIKKILK